MEDRRTTAEAARLLRAIPEVALDRDWITGKLMSGEDEPEDVAFYVEWNKEGDEDIAHPRVVKRANRAHAGLQPLPVEPVGCSAVVGCCVLGFVDLSTACANGFSMAANGLAKDYLVTALFELGWAGEVIRAVWEKNDGFGCSFEEYCDSVESDPESIGEEGIVPEWNDYHCTGKEQALELAAKAAELAEAAVAA